VGPDGNPGITHRHYVESVGHNPGIARNCFPSVDALAVRRGRSFVSFPSRVWCRLAPGDVPAPAWGESETFPATIGIG
jgi:hypothetical protein